MQDSGRVLCPHCAGELPEPTALCWHCGGDLHGMKLARPNHKSREDLYEIVPDGYKFGIAFRGEIKIHGLDLGKAQSLLSILNSVLEEAG